MVLELVAGQKVTYDDATGNYWYYILADFANKTYGEQTEAIDDLGTYGNIDGGWHMATPEEWAELWDEYAGKSVEGLFEPTFDGVTGKAWMGRSEDFIIAGFPYKTYIHGGIAIRTSDGITYDWDEGPSHFDTRDSETATFLGACVVSDQAVVPAPGALVLAATGLLSSTLGLNRLRRKHQEPSQI